jgi:NAD(P)-dependent dehydrogenase (short-subunit alcohol dehydrogenase family)
MKARTAGPVIVTGASRGLGLGIAERLAHAGNPVVLVARGADELDRAADAIRGRACEALAVRADVTNEADVERVAAVTRERFGVPLAVVNNAGAPPVLATLDELSWPEFLHGIEADVRGTFNTTRAVAAWMRAEGRGTIVNVASAAAGSVASPLHAAYSPAQAALHSLSACTASWLAPAGVAVHCVCPRLTLAGGVGSAAATKFGATRGITAQEWVERQLGSEALTPTQVGEAVVALLDEPDGRTWTVTPAGLTEWKPPSDR